MDREKSAIDRLSAYARYFEILQKRGLKSADVAKGTGIGASTFTDWKKGKSSPKPAKLKKIADYLEINFEYLLTGEDSGLFPVGWINEEEIAAAINELQYPDYDVVIELIKNILKLDFNDKQLVLERTKTLLELDKYLNS